LSGNVLMAFCSNVSSPAHGDATSKKDAANKEFRGENRN
jgi:hypothetical protein